MLFAFSKLLTAVVFAVAFVIVVSAEQTCSRPSFAKVLSSSLVILMSLVNGDCRQETFRNMFLEEGTQPSFSFSGDGLSADFEVLELPHSKNAGKTNPYSYDGKIIWKISVPVKVESKKWPKVTYGTLPDGLTQSVPNDGHP